MLRELVLLLPLVLVESVMLEVVLHLALLLLQLELEQVAPLHPALELP